METILVRALVSIDHHGLHKKDDVFEVTEAAAFELFNAGLVVPVDGPLPITPPPVAPEIAEQVLAALDTLKQINAEDSNAAAERQQLDGRISGLEGELGSLRQSLNEAAQNGGASGAAAADAQQKAGQAAETAAAAQETAAAAQKTAQTAQNTAAEAQQAAGTAQTAATEAKQTAEGAQTAAAAAKQTAQTAQSTAEAAAGTAQTAQQAADEAKQAAGSAQSVANTAKETATAAANKAQTAQQTAARAAETATAAQQTAQAAQQTAESAKLAAQTLAGGLDEERQQRTAADTGLGERIDALQRGVQTASETAEAAKRAAAAAQSGGGTVAGAANLLNPVGNAANRQIDNRTGNVQTTPSHVATDFIPVQSGRSYMMISVVSASDLRYAWFDSDKRFISGGTGGLGGFKTGLNAPARAAYLRFSASVNNNLGAMSLYPNQQ